MNTAVKHVWSQPTEEVDAVGDIMDDLGDLSNIFNIEDFELDNIPPVDPAQFGEQLHQTHAGTHTNTPNNVDFSKRPPSPRTATQDFASHDQFGIQPNMGQQQQFMMLEDHQAALMQDPYPSQPTHPPDIHQQYHYTYPQHTQQQPQQGYPSNHNVPPTPNSFEMHGEAGRFMQQQMDVQQRAMIEQQYHKQLNDRIQFTPMASPAGTPQFHVQPEFTVPGAYFSPLTSPALHAQTAQQSYQHQQGYYTNPSTAASSNATSPIDLNADVEMSMALPERTAPQQKKSRRKVTIPRGVTTGMNKRQSPIQKAQKRKSGALQSLVPSKDVDMLSLDNISQPGSAGLHASQVFGQSSPEHENTSPDAWSEALMGPPPRPGSSLTTSPALTGRPQEIDTAGGGAAATPKSLLSMRSRQQLDGQSGSASGGTTAHGGTTAQTGQVMDDLQLPEAAANDISRRPSLTQINTPIPPMSSTEQTSRTSARKTPKLGPLSTPSSARPSSATASPSVAFSPISASTPGALLKENKDTTDDRSNKKRGGAGPSGSAMVSPAFRPRISPIVKPLLPEGTALHSPTHALLLASKSNYQNMLEGNHLPGVTYPDSLSTGLTSKRTSHKFAEQGRRNRINEALKEMQALIPSNKGTKAGDEGCSSGSPEADLGADADGKESKESVAKSNNSKAATVESANRYIRLLKDSEAAQRTAVLALQRENEALKRRLEGQIGAANATVGLKESASPDAEMTVSEQQAEHI